MTTKRVFLIFGLLIISYILIAKELYWLFISLILFLIAYVVVTKLSVVIKNSLLKKYTKSGIIFLFLFSIAIGIKLFVLDIYKIPSSSMENTLFTKDVILVNKLKYGPRLPCSPFEIPWVNIAFYFNDNAKKRIDENWWSYRRLSGTTRVKQGDIFVFNFPGKKKTIVVKRCVALPGDKLSIKKGIIYTNNNLFSEANFVKNKYTFKITNENNMAKAIDSFGYDINFKNNSTFKMASLTKSELEYLET